jgi:predicted RNase H-like HicB family nuclease
VIGEELVPARASDGRDGQGTDPITYTAVLTPCEDGWICAQIAEIPEAISQGHTLDEAKANVAEALEWRRDEGEPLPERAEVTVTTVTVPGP